MCDHQCINDNCQSKPKQKLFVAQKSVCSYYNVKYRTDRQVCGACMQKCIIYLDRIGRRFKNGECILDEKYPKKQTGVIELSDSDDDNSASDSAVNNDTKPSTEDLNPQIAKLSTSLNTILKDTVGPLFKKQEELCESYLISKKAKLVVVNEQLNKIAEETDQAIARLYKNLYKFDNQRKFKFDEEVSIDDIADDVAIVSTKLLPGLPDGLPEEGKLIRHLLKVGDRVYGMKHSQMQPWIEATIKSSVSDTYFNIIFDDGEEKVLNYKNLAYMDTASHAQYPVGSRVIAKFQDMNIELTDKFYVGVIAEPPKYLNNFRYMIFFDDGYTQYVYHKNIRLVCGESPNVSDDVHENIREFVKMYLHKYPERPMVKFNKKQVVRTELNNSWCSAKVKNLDASLVQLKFLDIKVEHTEWMYRGSNRLGPIYNKLNSNNQDKRVRGTVLTDVNKLLNRPYIELENLTENEKSYNNDNSDNTQNLQENNGVTKSIEIPVNCPKPLPYKHHECSHFCMLWVHYDYSQTKYMNVLSIPLHYGFTRSVSTDEKLKLKKVIYTTPCGRNIDNENKMYNYLKLTSYGNSQMTIDLFNFDCLVNPLSSFSVPEAFIRIEDISYEMEFKSISVFNSLNDLVPDHIKYITERKTSPGVNLNIDPKFVCGCDCIDNCEDKNKCSCWQLTYEGPKNYPAIFKDHDDIGYSSKRLHKQVITGIFECNTSCKCEKTCLNRVVQEPLKTSLQLFLTEKKGWGVRTLADIPKGSFVCTYLGVVRTEKDADNDFSLNWGEYLADLDFLETVEEIKDGYESYVVQPEVESEDYTSSSDDEEFNPSWAIKSKMSMCESRMLLRKNLQDTNTKIDGKHELSKLNTQQKIESKNTSLLRYLDKDCGIYTLDAKVSGNIGRYFNHSCDPNIFIQNVFIDTHDLRFPWVSYFALSNIPAGTELVWDYNYIVGSVKNKKLMCHCGSKNCKGRLL
ncbi:histone-lysine N-methyltransferase eggless-like [Metopolophium dirhodum]|uniref:histone-lysine N-methyltransferase eggless-like n=1 Tax=Metopolophium dirhodum TaxID=44670 RepID=UPI00298F6E38|nr:histone-lysine N-methyltransferase eggless-like [Metopolophium dirhodum]